MKKIYYFLSIAVMAVSFVACHENERQTYNTGMNALNISFGADSVYSFADQNSSVVKDTIFLMASLIGVPVDYDRKFTVETTNKTNAPSGSYEIGNTVLKAGVVEDKIMIILNKTDALLDTSFTLELKLVPNENFLNGITTSTRLTFGNKLLKPVNWSVAISGTPLLIKIDAHYGIYSRVKHQLIIDATGDPLFWNKPLGTTRNYALQAKNYLIALNAYRATQGLDVLRNEFGNPVVIANGQ